MHGNQPADRVRHHWHLVLVDGVSILITICASLAMRLGTLDLGSHVQRIRLAIVLLVFLRLSLFALLGLYRPIRVPFTRRVVFSLLGAVAMSSSMTALVVLGFALPVGVVHWFPRSLLAIELVPGIILAGAIRLGQWAWESYVAGMSPERLHIMRARASLSMFVLFIALMALLSWQALRLVADLIPGEFGSLLSGIPIIFLSAILFLLPGLALLVILRPPLGLDPLEALILSSGLSVAAIPLLLYLCSLIGIPLNSLSVGVILVLLGAASVWRSRSAMRRVIDTIKLHWLERMSQPRLHKPRSHGTGALSETCMFYATLVMIFLMALLVRLWMVRDLVAPLGSDSVHHTMITQLLVDNDGLFSSWEPYAPLTSFTYHFGFHALSAFYHWLTGIPVIKCVIIVGQIINALAVPLMYLLTKRLTRSRWAGLIAALIPGFLSLMPMYYVNWGRYTQLAGQTILPVVMILAVDSVFAGKRDYCTVGITVLALAGLMVTHYLVTLMFFCFLATLLMTNTLQGWHAKRSVLNAWAVSVATVICALLLATPWLHNLANGPTIQAIVGWKTVDVPSADPSWVHQYNGVLAFSPMSDMFSFLPAVVFALSALGAIAGLVRTRREVITMVCWTSLLLLMANPHILHLPGTGLVTNTTIMIALYIPASVISGLFVADTMVTIRTKLPRIAQLAAIATLITILANYAGIASILTPDNVPVTQADMRAMEWIRAHTPSSAKFLVSTVLWEGPQTVMGTDAGWWLPLLTERDGTVPPMTYKEEWTSDPHYALKTNAFAEAIQDVDFADAETLHLLKDNGITHVYIGRKGSSLDPHLFANTACYEIVYLQDGAWVLEVRHDCLYVTGLRSMDRAALPFKRAT